MRVVSEENLARIYYRVKPFLSRRVQIFIRRTVAVGKRRVFQRTWPIDREAGIPPEGWGGWPAGKKFAVVLTHDVDTCRGVDLCLQLMALEQKVGFHSSFNFVAQGYPLAKGLRETLEKSGFEVGVHGLVHNREMYESLLTFTAHAERINEYLSEWRAVGFRSPCVYHNYNWLHLLKIRYDASSFDTDPFEPQSDGVKSIFPILMQGEPHSYVELPYTLPQDFTLFVLLREKGIGIWKQKLRWVVEHGGMALILTHPDYMSFSGKASFDHYPVAYYEDLLSYIKSEYEGEYWQVLPKEMATHWLNCFNGKDPSFPCDQKAEKFLMGAQLHKVRTL